MGSRAAHHHQEFLGVLPPGRCSHLEVINSSVAPPLTFRENKRVSVDTLYFKVSKNAGEPCKGELTELLQYIFWFPPSHRDVFLRVLCFSPLLKNQHFHILIRSGTGTDTFKGILKNSHVLRG